MSTEASNVPLVVSTMRESWLKTKRVPRGVELDSRIVHAEAQDVEVTDEGAVRLVLVDLLLTVGDVEPAVERVVGDAFGIDVVVSVRDRAERGPGVADCADEAVRTRIPGRRSPCCRRRRSSSDRYSG